MHTAQHAPFRVGEYYTKAFKFKRAHMETNKSQRASKSSHTSQQLHKFLFLVSLLPALIHRTDVHVVLDRRERTVRKNYNYYPFVASIINH